MFATDTISNSALVQPSAEALERVFGHAAALSPVSQQTLERGCELAELSQGAGMVQNPVVMVSLVVVFVGYALLLLLYGGYVGGISKVIFGRNIGSKVSDEISLLFLRAMRLFALLGVAMWALAGTKTLQWYGVECVTGIKDSLLAGAIALGILCVCAVQQISTRIICTITRRGALAEGLSLLSTALLALSAVVGTPLMLLAVANNGVSASIFIIALLAIATVALLCYIIKTFVFFVEQKISILLWILYLCAVVLLPMGIAATTLLQNSSL